MGMSKPPILPLGRACGALGGGGSGFVEAGLEIGGEAVGPPEVDVLDEIDIVAEGEDREGGGDVPEEMGALGQDSGNGIGRIYGAESECAEQEKEGEEDVLVFVPAGSEEDEQKGKDKGSSDHEVADVWGGGSGSSEVNQQENEPDGSGIKTEDRGEGEIPFSEEFGPEVGGYGDDHEARGKPVEEQVEGIGAKCVEEGGTEAVEEEERENGDDDEVFAVFPAETPDPIDDGDEEKEGGPGIPV